MRSGWVRRAAVAVAGVVIAAGCSSGAGPRPRADSAQPAVRAIASRSADASWPPASVLDVPEPSPPPASDGFDQAQAETFARYVVAEINYTWRTTYVETVLRNHDCRVCSPVAAAAAAAMPAHRLFRTDGWSVSSLSFVPVRQPGVRSLKEYLIDVVLDEPAVALAESDGTVVSRLPRRRVHTRMLLAGGFKWSLLGWVEVRPAGSAGSV